MNYSFFIISILAIIGLWIYCIVDIARNRFQNENNKLVYILVVVLAPIVGVLLYLAIWQKEKVRQIQ